MPGPSERVILAYSGGLDTSVAISWIGKETGREVVAVRESWLVEDRWWTGAPLRRRYWEVVTLAGDNLVVFRDLVGGDWFSHR